MKARNYKEIVEALSHYELKSVENKEDHDVLTIYGGLNGNGRFNEYLNEVSSIVFQLVDKFDLKMDDVWLVDWINDCLDDVFVLRIGVLNV